ncbi:hypothetical protein [Olleya sp. YS]|uniref:hypothetical protein n=1 Tax=Olleya sp. YS TaxID=3028318 RepID=UPI00243415A8|nr:hypothetical protein [Olleya sp. YS]WGD35820.1 hypothetical protein Ollyesu_05250 [Olleya sp. YS]
MSNTFQFAERLGFEPPFEFSDSTIKSIYRTGVIKWDVLIKALNGDPFTLRPFFGGQESNVSISNKSLEDYLLFSSKNRLKNIFINDSVDKAYKSGEKEYFFKTLISSQSNKIINKKNAGYSYNIALENNSFQRYRVLFPFNGRKTEDTLPDRYAISIETDNYDELDVLLKDLKLKYSDKKKEEIKKSFNSYFKGANGHPNIIDGIYRLAPKFVIESRGIEQLTNDLFLLLSIPVDENGTNEEFVVLEIIKALLKITKTNDEFLELFLKYFNDEHSLLSLITFRLDGQNFKEFVTIMHNAWKDSSYAEIDPLENKKVKITEKSPPLLSYNSKNVIGFHTDNAQINWKKSINEVDIDLTLGTGLFETIHLKNSYKREIKDTFNYKYHPFSPIVIVNADNSEFIFEDNTQKDLGFTKMPVFVLCAEDETAFWKNVITATEYAVDIATTFSGVGNILKVGRLAKILKAGHKLIGKTKTATKAIKITKTVAGIVEVTSGVGNALLKLAGKNDTPFGRAITKYLFYLEMLSLSGELSVALHVALKKSANDIIGSSKNRAKLKTELDGIKIDDGNVTRKLSDTEIDEVVEHLEETAGMTLRISKAKNADEFLESAKRLSKLKPEEALGNLGEALQHFNHFVKDGKVVRVSMDNCVNVVEQVEHFLRTGKIIKALPSEAQAISKLENIFGDIFLTYKLPSLKKVMKEGDRGIIYGDRGFPKTGHVFNVIKKDGELFYVDGQNGLKANLQDGFTSFKYLKTN